MRTQYHSYASSMTLEDGQEFTLIVYTAEVSGTFDSPDECDISDYAYLLDGSDTQFSDLPKEAKDNHQQLEDRAFQTGYAS